MKRIGVLAFHGDVIEHIQATRAAAKKLDLPIDLIEVRTKEQVKAIFGTCAGAIILAKKTLHKEAGQETLELMDMTIDRNAYGRQTESFEQKIGTKLGPMEAVFIRAPKIISVGSGVTILAKNNSEIIACEQRSDGKFYLATCFHPELTITKFHEYFLKQIYGN